MNMNLYEYIQYLTEMLAADTWSDPHAKAEHEQIRKWLKELYYLRNH